MALENPRIKADVIEASEFPQLSQRYRVVSVPKTIVNEKTEFVGSLPAQQILQHVQSALAGKNPGTS
jgi:alkyl hydroperoxide reductase subunit AhpF